MRVRKAIVTMSLVTMAALLYVHQQVELVKLSYEIESKEKKFNVMLDHRDSLVYNIDNLEAPSRLERILVARNINVALPKKGYVVKIARSGYNSNMRDHIKHIGLEGRSNIMSGILDFFSPKAEAHSLKELQA